MITLFQVIKFGQFFKVLINHRLGTDAGLLEKPLNSNTFKQILNKDVLDKKIMSIEEDWNQNLWMGNTQGLIKYSLQTKESRCYTYNDGLQSNTFTAASAMSSDGTMYFGGISGINYFDPQKIADPEYNSAILFSDFKINNLSINPCDLYKNTIVLDSSINLKSEITLNYRQNNFAVEFAGIPFNNIIKQEYRYKLIGYDNDWNYVNYR